MTGLHFVLMLTERDVTIPDAMDVYQTVTGTGLRYVAFKDVGADHGMLGDLTGAAREDGLQTLLEIGATNSSTIVFPAPIELLRPFLHGLPENAPADGAKTE